MAAVLFTMLTFVSTLLGGVAALRARDRLHLLLGFSAGAVIGVVLFDILPELIDLAAKARIVVADLMPIVAAGFLSFFFLERVTALHGGREHEHKAHTEHQQELGVASAVGLSIHSFIDGVAIGAAFSASSAVGLLVGFAVLAHDFSDGLNTVTVLLAHGNRPQRAARWLLIDATAPALGALTVLLLHVPASVLPFILAFFVGFFTYIGSSDLLPEAREHDSPWVAVASVSGMVVIYTITRFL